MSLITSSRACVKKVSALPVALLFGSQGSVGHRQTDPCNSLVSQLCESMSFRFSERKHVEGEQGILSIKLRHTYTHPCEHVHTEHTQSY